MILILGCPARCLLAVIQGLMFSVAQAGLDLTVILLPQLPKLWDYSVCHHTQLLAPVLAATCFPRHYQVWKGEMTSLRTIVVNLWSPT